MSDMMPEIQMEHPDKVPVVPVPRPNRERILSIPIGAHVVTINFPNSDPPEIGGLRWTTETQESALAQLEGEDDEFGGTFMIYVKPEALRSDDQPVRSADDIIQQALSEWKPTGEIHSDVQRILTRTITLAREGMTVNPF